MSGSCLCGRVRFEIAGWVSPIQACHAARCRKATGAAFSPEIATAADGFRWVQGEENISVFEAPLIDAPPPYRKAFCRTCGSPLPIRIEGVPIVILQAGVLDGQPDLRLFRHAFVAQKACWHEILDTLPAYDGQPPPPV